MENNKPQNNPAPEADTVPAVPDNDAGVEPNAVDDYSAFKEKISANSRVNKKVTGLSYVALVFAFLLPPIGLIIALVSRSRSKDENRPTHVATAAIIISSLMFLGLLSGGSFIVYRSYDQSKTAQKANQAESSQNQAGKNKIYSEFEKKSIAQGEQFLKDIKSEDYAAAFKLLSPELQKEYPNGEADFTKEVTTANLKLVDSWTISNATTNGKEDRVTVVGDAVFRGANPSGKFEFQFYKDGSGPVKMFLWQISPNT